MGVIFVLICASTTVAAGFLLAFLWAVKQGQFKDDYTPSLRILFDDHIKSQVEDKTTNLNKSK
jgi:cbb3-type cytochrome oxidase maturation protein